MWPVGEGGSCPSDDSHGAGQRLLQAPSVHARRPEGATDLDEGAKGAVEGGAAAPGDDGREADGAPGPSGKGAPAAEDLSEFLAGKGEDPGAYAARIFQRVFCNDIESVLRMDVRCFADLSALRALALCFGATCTNSGLQLPT